MCKTYELHYVILTLIYGIGFKMYTCRKQYSSMQQFIYKQFTFNINKYHLIKRTVNLSGLEIMIWVKV